MNKRSEKGASGLASQWTYYRNEARRKGFEFALDREYFKNVVADVCHFCGSQPTRTVTGPKSRQSKYGEDHSEFLTNEIERVDLAQGYVPGNCITCCQVCRKIKRDMDSNDFYNWLERTHSFSKKKLVNIPKTAKAVYAP